MMSVECFPQKVWYVTGHDASPGSATSQSFIFGHNNTGTLVGLWSGLYLEYCIFKLHANTTLYLKLIQNWFKTLVKVM